MSDQVHSITDAPLKHSEEQYSRMLRYTVAMVIRIICFIAAAVVGVVWQSWWAMIFVAAAVVLPYVAVINANAGGDRYMARREDAPERQAPLPARAEQHEAEARQWWEDDDAGSAGPDQGAVISGEVVEDDRGRQKDPRQRQEEG